MTISPSESHTISHLDSGSSLNFKPPVFMRHPNTQNLLSSLGLRGWLLKRRSENLLRNTKTCIVDGGQGVRLSGEISLQPESSLGMVILLHGWEGSSKSAYLVSAALALFNAGFSVFRLNMRDHGDSHALNEELFNSTLLDEVLHAIKDIQKRWPSEKTFVGGYSLGGNFALRIALQAPQRNTPIDRVVAICPVIDPALTLIALQNSHFMYEKYFVRKWQKSLLKKLECFPHYNYRSELMKLKDLASMHDFFVPRFTGFADRNSYFSAYAVSAEQLEQLEVPTHIINSEDDPITEAKVIPTNIKSNLLSIVRSDYGSHCAFLKDYGLNSWADDQLIRLFSKESY